MSNEAKTEILRRIKNSLDDAPLAPEIPRDYRRVSDQDPAAILTMLEERLLDYKAAVFHETAQSLPLLLAKLCIDATKVIVPEGIDHSWLPSNSEEQFLFEAPGHPLPVHELNDTIDAVVTSSTVSCAETGTIFLTGRPDEGRRAISLVPDHHICIVSASSVVELIPEALAQIEPTAPITMISGPSATSDIELERVEGVHGPRRLDVVLLS
ncbi:LutC/YkgG family protein [Corynebacterium alimapuense]|uniref:Lactate utilization protein C n=1 Tax=Corynebacterium alimapuense TaxID=1576874 RepID=A0A3M8K4L7_9CORY|nr:LUD domain-containing protein [Corynebacterium alimapuense]RNE48167.1 lactate utilization protein C [Corynebacterium alimapuense]